MNTSRARAGFAIAKMLAAMSLIVSCDSMIHVRGDVTVPLAILRHFSSDQPGRVYVTAYTTSNTPELFDGIAILCGGNNSDLVIPLQLDRTGCPREMLLIAKVSIVSQSPALCGVGGHAPGVADSEALVAQVTQIIFAGITNCSDRTATVHLTVAQTKPQSDFMRRYYGEQLGWYDLHRSGIDYPPSVQKLIADVLARKREDELLKAPV